MSNLDKIAEKLPHGRLLNFLKDKKSCNINNLTLGTIFQLVEQ